MKVVICQGEYAGGEPSREEMLACWEKELAGITEISEIIYKEKFDPAHPDEMVEDADAILGVWLQKECFNEELFRRHPNLKYIATFAHGFGEIDREAVKRHGITMTNTIYGDVTIAQFAMALLLDICHSIRLQDAYYKRVLDNKTLGYPGTHACTRQIELYEKTFGIIGLGSIGLWAAKMAAGFGMKVIAYNRSIKVGREYDFIEQVSLEELYKRSDVISIHCPATTHTYHMINKDSITQMKDGVILINTARGSIICEEDLIKALNSGKVYAAGLDVVENEPLKERCALMSCENAVITAHIAWVPREARYRTVRIAADNFKNWLQGTPTSVIS